MEDRYWTKSSVWDRRLSRRSVLGGIGAAGLSAAFLAACGGNSNNGGNQNTNSGSATKSGGAAPAAAGSSAATAAARSATAAAAPAKRGGSLKYSGAETFTNLDPTYSGSYMDLFNSFEPLLALGTDGTPQANDNSLATAYEQADQTDFIFHLRQGVKFHDGGAFNAASVKFSLDRIVQPQPPGQIWKSVMVNYDHVETPDDGTAKVVLKKPDGSLLLLLADVAGMQISPQTYANKALTDVAWTTGGTGPYKLTDHVLNSYRKWQRFTDYWRKLPDGGSAALLDNVESDEIPDPTVKSASLQSGQLDLIASNSADPAPGVLDNDPNLQMSHRDGYGLVCLLLNHAIPPLDNVNFRRALAWAIDRSAVTKSFFQNVYNADIHSCLSPASWAWKSATNFPGFDMQKAKQFLDASGIAPADRKVTVTGIGATNDAQAFALFQNIFQPLGIQLVYVDASAAKGKVYKNQGDTPSVQIVANYPQLNKADPNLLFGPYLTTGGVFNMSGVALNDMDNLVAQAASTYDINQRKSLYGQIQDIQADQMSYMIPLAIRPTRVWAKKNVVGIAYRPSSGWPLYSGLGAS